MFGLSKQQQGNWRFQSKRNLSNCLPIKSSEFLLYTNTLAFTFVLDQKLKVSIAEWNTNNQITGRIVAHYIAHALGIKLDYNKLPPGTNPPSFNGQSDRYDSNGNSCTNISGLMDSAYLTDVDKFTTCSREDYKAYYNRVLDTYGTFCLDCSKLHYTKQIVRYQIT